MNDGEASDARQLPLPPPLSNPLAPASTFWNYKLDLLKIPLNTAGNNMKPTLISGFAQDAREVNTPTCAPRRAERWHGSGSASTGAWGRAASEQRAAWAARAQQRQAQTCTSALLLRQGQRQRQRRETAPLPWCSPSCLHLEQGRA